MLRSMTGYGKAVAKLNGKSVTLEIRSLNSKQLDLNLRLHPALRDNEPDIRSVVTRMLERGKVELTGNIDFTGTDLPAAINRPVAISYYNELSSLARELGASEENLLSVVMKMPEVTRLSKEEINGEDWGSIFTALNEALQQLDEFRKHEGELLEKDFILRIETIQSLLAGVEPFELNRNLQLREKLRNSFADFIENNNFDTNRFEQEIIYYLEKLDITEEKVRLAKHCKYFLETLDEDTANGRKLSFVSQEIGREINTMGSKANDADIQKLVVRMKDELEKIKEQLANIL
ncbi:YicC/YloC family endoribonuclease [Lentimicrobium sp.]|uniref:YicC/YloC family endoribonuclease n=1 Tax=Lentimicrobium sp. TaxID=2034841 RepID=UPI002C54CE8E|nr:YicC/YloC family endoribonuclease [Lentimicrobium sp.]HPF63367.1 YicC family protein [Lentimicrobium sp.]HPR27143.1 YicC family protein [Lentimicrobium sp.]